MSAFPVARVAPSRTGKEFSYRARAWLPTLSAGLTARENISDDLQKKANKTLGTAEATKTERGE